MLTVSDGYIPRTMATQHPDNASAPFWHPRAMITAAEEVQESLTAWREFGCEEVKWDWEGKLVEESVLERLLLLESDYFRQSPLGEKQFLTFRIPHPDKEQGGRYWRALTNLITAQKLAQQLSLHLAPITEIIVPQVTSAEELITIHQDITELTDFFALKFGLSAQTFGNSLRIIPLVESIPALSSYDRIIAEYSDWFYHTFKQRLRTFRPYIARSDPALQSGLLAAVLVSKLAIDAVHRQGKKSKIDMYPIVGMGSLPFRGGLSPETFASVLDEYQGVATFTIQSAFRYDYAKTKAERAIDGMNRSIFSIPAQLPPEEKKFLVAAIASAEKHYQRALQTIVPFVQQMAPFVPKRRERFSSEGIFSYGRRAETATLPRAITFTASLYSLGLPPELLGVGAALQDIFALPDGERLFEKHYPSFGAHILMAGQYLNKNNLHFLAKKHPVLTEIIDDISLIEQLLQTQLEPQEMSQQRHAKVTSTIVKQVYGSHLNTTNVMSFIEKSARLRKSIG